MQYESVRHVDGRWYMADVDHVFHYSEDGTLSRFVPYVSSSNPGHPAAVWAVDELHSPLYWFPRDCPRVSVWAYDDEQRRQLRHLFGTEAHRICAAESSWLPGVASGRMYRYRFDAAQFRPWPEADGQYVCDDVVEPQAVEPLDDLLALHSAAEVELRFTPRLGELTDKMLGSGLPFSFVRIRDARR